MTIWEKISATQWRLGACEDTAASVSVYKQEGGWCYEVVCVRGDVAHKLVSSEPLCKNAAEAKKSAWGDFLRGVEAGEYFDFLDSAEEHRFGKKEWGELGAAMTRGYPRIVEKMQARISGLERECQLLTETVGPEIDEIDELENLAYEAAGYLSMGGDNWRAEEIVAEILAATRCGYDRRAINVKITVG